MTSTARFDNWQNRLGTQAGSIDSSGNVTFDNDVTVTGGITQGGVLMPTAADLNALPRGVIGKDRVTGGTNPRTFTAYTESDLSTITFTAVAGRLYKATGTIHVFDSTTVCQVFGIIEVNGTNLSATYSSTSGSGNYANITSIETFTASGATTVKFQIRPNAVPRVYMGSVEGWFLLIEDIGLS